MNWEKGVAGTLCLCVCVCECVCVCLCVCVCVCMHACLFSGVISLEGVDILSDRPPG